ncbi:uncharacterized protein LOC128640063 [Bombina bombina]|uniref:uncharacterized protein LOC128640063 n=1 Tax=Bombina bombina TaxID=8345 RepID=UPI00235A6F79|nr:uncharacterized protein LOC128640063 [Bombina bombina]XP_053548357.1 uncharacterized protein LOC128640063 [Bombina bombina]XP_053548358.1 uncharacterized protein LOC128640063 [Bombina bombina]
MSTNIVKDPEGNVSYETSDGTVVNIHINQRSFLDALFDAIRTLRKSIKGQKPTSQSTHGAQRGLGASQITLGCICVSIAIILCFGPDLQIHIKGMLFWVGFPFIISGALSVLADHRRIFVVNLFSGISHIVSIGVAVAGLVILASDFKRFPWYRSSQNFCDSSEGYYGWRYETSARPYLQYRKKECEKVFNAFMRFFGGGQILILLLVIWGLCISLFSLGFRLKIFCCKHTSNTETVKENDESLMKSPHKEPEMI